MQFFELGQALVVLGGLAMIGVAQGFVRERSPDAAQKLSIGGGLTLVPLITHFVPVHELHAVVPLVMVAAAGAGIWGLFILADELHPRQQGLRLPMPLDALRGHAVGAGLGARLVFAFFAVCVVVATGRMFDTAATGGVVLGCIAAVLGGHFINQRGSWAVWVLERHPEWVVWIYPSKLTVVSQRYGTRTVHWRAVLGLQNGLRLLLPAGSEEGAANLSANAAAVCPSASLGHTGELEAKFAMSPGAMRKT